MYRNNASKTPGLKTSPVIRFLIHRALSLAEQHPDPLPEGFGLRRIGGTGGLDPGAGGFLSLLQGLLSQRQFLLLMKWVRFGCTPNDA